MEVLRQVKELYSGKNAISNHVTLFSILGIVVILLNNVVAAWGQVLFILISLRLHHHQGLNCG